MKGTTSVSDEEAKRDGGRKVTWLMKREYEWGFGRVGPR
jgi:hypothetical protein